jgi:hypothetical protein
MNYDEFDLRILANSCLEMFFLQATRNNIDLFLDEK